MDLLILSGSSRVRTAAGANHRVYADRWGLDSVFDTTPAAVPSIYLHKVKTVRRFLPHHEWLFWIDDDAFFTQLDIDVRSFLSDAGEHDLLFCASPVNPRGGWTWMSAGQFFIRRTPAMLELLDAVLDTDLAEVRPWWRPDELGLFTDGDQDAFVYQLLRDDSPWAGSFARLPWEGFNSRPYHYRSRLDEHFLCHFAVPGTQTKAELILEFAERMGTSAALVDPALLEPYRVFLERSDMWPYLDGEGGRGTAPPETGLATRLPKGRAAAAAAGNARPTEGAGGSPAGAGPAGRAAGTASPGPVSDLRRLAGRVKRGIGGR